MTRGTFIENEAAYEEAKWRNIKINAAKTRRAKWMAMDGAERANDFLFELGDFSQSITTRDPAKAEEFKSKLSALDPNDSHYWQDRDLLDEMYGTRYETHPAVRACFGEFFAKMRDSVNDWGGLTEGQNKAVLAMIVRGEKRVAERAKARAEQQAKDADLSGWIGSIGERRVFDLTIRTLIEMDGTYGRSYLHVCQDGDGNVVVYKGTSMLGKRGDVVSIKATVKDHDVREGVKQTKISRPKSA